MDALMGGLSPRPPIPGTSYTSAGCTTAATYLSYLRAIITLAYCRHDFSHSHFGNGLHFTTSCALPTVLRMQTAHAPSATAWPRTLVLKVYYKRLVPAVAICPRARSQYKSLR